jgi:hypothetical protein
MMSPPLRFSLFVFAAMSAAFPAVFGSMKWRIAGGVIIIAVVIFAIGEWPSASDHMRHYRERHSYGHQIQQSQNPIYIAYPFTNTSIY